MTSRRENEWKKEVVHIMDFMEIRRLFHIEGNIGYSAETIEKAVRKFGRLPKVLTEYYRQLGKHSGLNQANYKFCSPGKLELLIYGEYLCFCKAKEEPAYWYVDLAKEESDNSPVYRRYFNGSAVCDVLDSDTLEEFLYVMAYWQALFSLPYHGVVRFMTLEQIEKIQKNMRFKPYHLSRWPQFYGNNSDEIISIQREKSWAHVCYACTTEEQLNKIRTMIEG